MSLVTTFNPFGPDNSGWKAYPSNLTDGIVRIYYGNNKYFAQTESKIYYSLDGLSWSQCTVPSDTYTGGTLLWCGDKYVHVGRSGGLIDYGIYSYDGITWAKFNFPESNYFNTFSYGNGIYIAIIIAVTDGFSTNDYFYSTNGINWTKYELPEQQYNFKIAFKNGVFVIVTECRWVGNRNYFFRSTDGINWSSGLSVKELMDVYDIITTNDKFYVFSDKGYYTSTDGNTWITYSYNGYNGESFSGGRWLLHKKDGDYTWNNYTTFRLIYEYGEGKPKYIKNGYKFVRPIYNPDTNKYFTVAINNPVVAFY